MIKKLDDNVVPIDVSLYSITEKITNKINEIIYFLNDSGLIQDEDAVRLGKEHFDSCENCNISKLIDDLPKKFPDIESDFYDEGYSQACADIKALIEKTK